MKKDTKFRPDVEFGDFKCLVCLEYLGYFRYTEELQKKENFSALSRKLYPLDLENTD